MVLQLQIQWFFFL